MLFACATLTLSFKHTDCDVRLQSHRSFQLDPVPYACLRFAAGVRCLDEERTPMLHDFVTLYRDDIIGRARTRVTNRPWPLDSTSELEYGVSLFLTQLAETLRLEESATPFSSTAIGSSAARHGRELLAMGFNLSQVVHDYGDICQAITELAVEQNASITTDEFQILNRSLDSAIAGAVTEHARITAESRGRDEVERTGQCGTRSATSSTPRFLRSTP